MAFEPQDEPVDMGGPADTPVDAVPVDLHKSVGTPKPAKERKLSCLGPFLILFFITWATLFILLAVNFFGAVAGGSNSMSSGRVVERDHVPSVWTSRGGWTTETYTLVLQKDGKTGSVTVDSNTYGDCPENSYYPQCKDEQPRHHKG